MSGDKRPHASQAMPGQPWLGQASGGWHLYSSEAAYACIVGSQIGRYIKNVNGIGMENL